MDYRQQSGEARVWRRAAGVTINNPLDGQATIVFHEEDVVTVGGQAFRQTNAGMVTGAFDVSGVIELLHPESGEPLGETATQLDLYVILHSLYLQLAQRRDAELENLPPPFPGAGEVPAEAADPNDSGGAASAPT